MERGARRTGWGAGAGLGAHTLRAPTALAVHLSAAAASQHPWQTTQGCQVQPEAAWCPALDRPAPAHTWHTYTQIKVNPRTKHLLKKVLKQFRKGRIPQ